MAVGVYLEVRSCWLEFYDLTGTRRPACLRCVLLPFDNVSCQELVVASPRFGWGGGNLLVQNLEPADGITSTLCFHPKSSDS